MLISELTFPHLAEAREAQLVQQLERRRVVAERLAEASADAAPATDEAATEQPSKEE